MSSVHSVLTVEALMHSFSIDRLIGFSESCFHQTICQQCGGDAIPILQVGRLIVMLELRVEFSYNGYEVR